MPDRQTEFLLMQIFGRGSYPMLKLLRMRLWLTRFKHINPFPVPAELPAEPVRLARLALRHMEPDLSAQVTVYQVASHAHSPRRLPPRTGPCAPAELAHALFYYC